MEFRPLYLISYFAAVAFLLAWLARLILAFYRWSRKVGSPPLLCRASHSFAPPWAELTLEQYPAGGLRRGVWHGCDFLGWGLVRARMAAADPARAGDPEP